MKPQWPEKLSGQVVVLFRRQAHMNIRRPRVSAPGKTDESRSPCALPVSGAHDRRTREAMVEKVPMTLAGFAALGEELKKRQSVDRPRIIEHIAEARSHGDLSENAEYHAAKEEQSHNEGRIAELEDKLARADVIDISKLSGDTIKFGATVTLVDEDTEKKTVWQLVGEVEADAKKGRISITSPLARALIGKKKGSTVEVNAPGGAKAYEITKVEWR
jgi:transcription elongation factor GreA